MIFDRMRPQYGPQAQGGPRYQSVFDREALADMGGGMGFMRFMRRPDPNGGINPRGMYTGGNQRPQVGLPPMAGPGQVFQAPQFQTGGNAPPMQQNPWMTGGNQQPQSSLSRWFNTFRQGAYR